MVAPEATVDCDVGDTHEPITIWHDAASLNTTKQGPKVQLIFRDAAGRVWGLFGSMGGEVTLRLLTVSITGARE